MPICGLSLEEIDTLGELLASIPEPFVPMEPDRLDGFLVAIALMRRPPQTDAWLARVFDEDANPAARLDQSHQTTLRRLILARGAELEAAILGRRPIDPILFEEELSDADPFAALRPFSEGFSFACALWPELLQTDDKAIQAALVGILRYAHVEEDDTETQGLVARIDEEIAFASLDEALEDLKACVGEIAEITRKPR